MWPPQVVVLMCLEAAEVVLLCLEAAEVVLMCLEVTMKEEAQEVGHARAALSTFH
jgi:hypothetical protein